MEREARAGGSLMFGNRTALAVTRTVRCPLTRTYRGTARTRYWWVAQWLDEAERAQHVVVDGVDQRVPPGSGEFADLTPWRVEHQCELAGEFRAEELTEQSHRRVTGDGEAQHTALAGLGLVGDDDAIVLLRVIPVVQTVRHQVTQGAG